MVPDQISRAERVPSGFAPLDAILGGGFERRTITQFYGEPASGKSTFCVIAAVACLRSGRSVVFIDTEGFSIERFGQVAGAGAESLAERLFLYEPVDFDQQGIMIAGSEQILRTRDPGMIVLDSATGLYRTNLERGRDAMQRLTKQMVHLLGLAKRYDIPALITNQVYMDVVRNTYCGLGGTALEHISKAIIQTSRVDGFRRATLVKHRSQPAGGCFDFEITPAGVELHGRQP
ncbi:MAG: DNA repair and recombination protein RadB [Methanoregulaceae archaeon]|nr:DNA repair and recombination protein RadB [Methanoregulaceae archaeon]